MKHLRRWGLVWAAALTGLILVGNTLWTYTVIRAHAAELAGIHFEYLWSQRPHRGEPLSEQLHALRPLGVHAIRRFDKAGNLIESVGDGPPSTRIPSEKAELGRFGHYLSAETEGDELFVFEYRPLLAEDMQSRARTSALISAVAALLLLASTALWIRDRLHLEAAEREATRNHHLTQLGVLSAVVAHELRNPLTSLLGHVQLLREDLPEDASVQHIEDGALRLDALLDSLLAFARTGEVSPAPTDPRSLVLGAAQDAGVQVIIQGEAPPWPLDALRMRQVLVNLISNAHAAAPDGQITATVHADRAALRIAIQDQGPGIPEDQLTQVFEPFFTTRIHGTGLGLSVARDIVAKHGGTLTAENAPGSGAIFTIRIPHSWQTSS